MLALALTLILLCASQSATGNSCKDIGRDDFTIEVDVTNGRATAYLSMKNLSTTCPSLQYNVTVRDGRSSTPMKCSRVRGEKFVCPNLELNTDFSLLVAIDNNGVRQQKNYRVYTTDTQEITALTGTTTADITCHFANGTLCRGCVVKWSRNGSKPQQKIIISRDSRLLTGTETITGLIPGRAYSLIGYDLEFDGTESAIGVEGQLVTKEESDDAPITVVWISIVTILLCICAVLIILVLVLMKRWKKGKVSVKRISSLRAKAKARTESKEMHIRKTEDNYLEVGPPLPPRTLDMFIPVADDNSTSADSASTESTAVTVEDGDSATATLNQHQAFATTLDTVSISSDPPPIPPRTADLFQDDTTDSDINLTSENTSSSHQLPSTVHHPMASNRLHAWQVRIHDPKSGLDTVSISSDPPPIPPRTADFFQDDTTDSDLNLTSENTSASHQLQHPMASNRLHAWQVSIHDPKSHKWFVFPRMLQVAHVNADCIPMHPNLSYETFAKNGSATY